MRTMQLALELGPLVDMGLLWRFPNSSPRRAVMLDTWTWDASVFESRTEQEELPAVQELHEPGQRRLVTDYSFAWMANPADRVRIAWALVDVVGGVTPQPRYE